MSSTGFGRVPPIQNRRQAEAPERLPMTRNWIMATISSNDTATMISMDSAVIRQTVHQAPTATGWSMISTTLVIPSGTTTMPNIATIHGIVRQRRASPITAASSSIR